MMKIMITPAGLSPLQASSMSGRIFTTSSFRTTARLTFRHHCHHPPQHQHHQNCDISGNTFNLQDFYRNPAFSGFRLNEFQIQCCPLQQLFSHQDIHRHTVQQQQQHHHQQQQHPIARRDHPLSKSFDNLRYFENKNALGRGYAPSYDTCCVAFEQSEN